MSRRRQKTAKAPDRPADRGRRPVLLLAEALTWAWAVGVLGYFYYSRKFLELLQQVWETFLG